jgi:predicted small lipoprotein YifL
MARLFAFAAALAAVGALAGCGSSGHHGTSPAAGTTASGTTTATAPNAGPTPRCASSALAVWLGVGEGGGTAGGVVYPLEFTNTTGASCHLRGFPGVSAWAGSQLGSPAGRNHAVPAQTVTLAKGHTAHALIRFADVGAFSPTSCRPKTAGSLRVFPPDERASRLVPFSFEACSKPGPVYLTVRVVEPGVGIPGFSH